MANIIVPSRRIWTRQPQQAVEIDWANPVMSWVGDVFMPIGGKLVKFSRPESVLGAKTDNDSGVIISKIGIGVTVAQASMGSSFSRVGAYATTQVSQLAVLTNPASFGGNAFGHVCGVWGYYDDGFSINCTGEKWQARINAASNTTLTGGAANIMQSGVVSMAWDGATLSLIDMGGGLYSTSVSGTLAVTSSPYSIGGVNLALNYGYNGGVHLVLSGRRFATIGQRRELHNNPWQIFAPQKRYSFFDMGAGGGSTLNASASGAAQASGSATLAAQVALAGVGVAIAGGSAAASVAVPLSAAGLAVAGGSGDASATVTIAAAGLAQAAGAAGLSAGVLLAGAGAAQAAGNAALAAQLEALAAGAAQASGSANLSGGAPGNLSASGGDVASGLAVLSVTVALQAAGAAQASGSASGSAGAPGDISASGGAQGSGSAIASATVTLTVAGFVQAMGSGQMAVQVSLAAYAQAVSSGSASISQAGVTVLLPAGGAYLPRRGLLCGVRPPNLSAGRRPRY